MSYILEISTIVDISHQLRSQGKKVIFTHGTFDLFHTGHAYVLETAKKRGDVLIVGVEPDSNVKKYKKRDRPIFSAPQRAKMISIHKDTDFVLYIDELDTVADEYYLTLYEKLLPNYVVLGKNFAIAHRHKEHVPGVRFCKLGRLIQNPQEITISSTSQVIKKIKSI